MQLIVTSIGATEATEASALVQASFMQLAAADWEPSAQSIFLFESSPEEMARKQKTAALSLGAFYEDKLVGVLLMPSPVLLAMLFVQPQQLRRGVARSLWENARSEIEKRFPSAKTVELNSTPYAYGFYRSVGFAPISAEFRVGGCRATRMACWLPARALGAENAL